MANLFGDSEKKKKWKVPLFLDSGTKPEMVGKGIFAQISANLLGRMSADDRASMVGWLHANYSEKSAGLPVPSNLNLNANARRFYDANRAAKIQKSLAAAKKQILASNKVTNPNEQLRGLRLLHDVAALMGKMAERTKGGDHKMSRGEMVAFQNRLNALISGSSASEDYQNLARMLGAPSGLNDPLGTAKQKRFY